MSEPINITGCDKAEVLAALYHASKQQGMGFLHARGASSMSRDEAEQELKHSQHFDYLHGRIMKISLNKDTFCPRLYDRNNGEGAARRALAGLVE